MSSVVALHLYGICDLECITISKLHTTASHAIAKFSHLHVAYLVSFSLGFVEDPAAPPVAPSGWTELLTFDGSTGKRSDLLSEPAATQIRTRGLRPGRDGYKLKKQTKKQTLNQLWLYLLMAVCNVTLVNSDYRVQSFTDFSQNKK